MKTMAPSCHGNNFSIAFCPFLWACRLRTVEKQSIWQWFKTAWYSCDVTIIKTKGYTVIVAKYFWQQQQYNNNNNDNNNNDYNDDDDDDIIIMIIIMIHVASVHTPEYRTTSRMRPHLPTEANFLLLNGSELVSAVMESCAYIYFIWRH